MFPPQEFKSFLQKLYEWPIVLVVIAFSFGGQQFDFFCLSVIVLANCQQYRSEKIYYHQLLQMTGIKLQA
jgi:hypothetical protein